MLERCYSEKRQKIQPTYKDCTVHADWRNYQLFAKWYYENYPSDGEKYDIDKDILVEGNRVYSPEACMFVTRKENTVKALAKSYAFVSPDGIEVEIYNMAEFCRGNDLNHVAMCQVHLGKASQHKGWRLA